MKDTKIFFKTDKSIDICMAIDTMLSYLERTSLADEKPAIALYYDNNCIVRTPYDKIADRYLQGTEATAIRYRLDPSFLRMGRFLDVDRETLLDELEKIRNFYVSYTITKSIEIERDFYSWFNKQTHGIEYRLDMEILEKRKWFRILGKPLNFYDVQ